MFDKIIRVAYRPPHAAVVKNDAGERGWWAELPSGERLFLNENDNRILLPKALRGKHPDMLTEDDLKAVPAEDSGLSHYQNWLHGFNRTRSAEQLFTGFEFTEKGTMAVRQLFQAIAKLGLSDATQLGIDGKYSIDPSIATALLHANNLSDVQKLGKAVGRKIVTACVMLGQLKPRAAKRLRQQMAYYYKKLEAVFDFDYDGFQPKVRQPKEAAEPDEGANAQKLIEQAYEVVEQVRPYVNAQMSDFWDGLNKFLQASTEQNFDSARLHFEAAMKSLLYYIQTMPGHPIATSAEHIIALPALVHLHHELFGN